MVAFVSNRKSMIYLSSALYPGFCLLQTASCETGGIAFSILYSHLIIYDSSKKRSVWRELNSVLPEDPRSTAWNEANVIFV